MKFQSSLKRLCFIIIGSILITSCVSREKIAYFQNMQELELEKNASINNLEIKANDLITITVNAYDLQAAQPFNLPVVGVRAGQDMEASLRVSGQPQLQPYLVDSEGYINFPELGRIKVEGLSRIDLAADLQEQLSEYVDNPIVNVRIVNFQVSVLGEVNRPGTFTVMDEYLTVPKALGLAGDMTIYGKRDNVLVVREEDGSKSYEYLDLSQAEVVNSPYYYLKQNDVVYVEPNRAQRQSSTYNRNASIYISIASVLVSLTVLIAR
ncbi:MAG: polysaccharide biosynthesis/export family protein [Psychroflexus sp.]